VQATDRVLDLKKAIALRLTVLASDQTLLCKPFVLEDDRLLSEYKTGKGAASDLTSEAERATVLADRLAAVGEDEAACCRRALLAEGRRAAVGSMAARARWARQTAYFCMLRLDTCCS
jgi:hypothetical protein